MSKVDWLVDQVREIKQTLSSFENSERRLNSHYGHYATKSSEYNRVNSSEQVTNNQRHENKRPSIFGSCSTAFKEGEYYDRKPSSPLVYKSALFKPSISARSDVLQHGASNYVYEGRDEYDMRAHGAIPYKIPSRSDRGTKYYDDSPASTSSRSEHIETLTMHNCDSNQQQLLPMSESINIVDVIYFWQRGINDSPPICRWNQEQKLRYRDQLQVWFRIYHLFRVVCAGDMDRFITQYTDQSGHLMGVTHVASLCPDVTIMYNRFMTGTDQQQETVESNSEKMYLLPRKINGRKVSAKDVIQLWEHGIGDIPAIKHWTKTQKFKQQSKISRWKKIVDIFNYQCGNDMKKFEEIYTDGHGCLLPVAAITTKFETIYGDELNITSKLMTVSTSNGNSTEIETTDRKRSSSFTESYSSLNKRRHTEDEGYLSVPPSLIRKSPSPLPPQMEQTEILKEAEPEENMTTYQKVKCEAIEFENDLQSPNIHPIFSNSYQQEECAINYDNQSSPSNSESDTNENNIPEKQNPDSPYLLSSNISAKEAILFWNEGSVNFPPIKCWSPRQRENQSGLISDIEGIYNIFKEIFKLDMNSFLLVCSNENREPLSINEIITKFRQNLKEKVNTIGAAKTSSSMTFDFSHHKTISQSTNVLHLLPRKINGRKVSAKDVIKLWYHGMNKIPPVKQWSPQQKAVQQSKVSRWKKIVDLFEKGFEGDWGKFKARFSNSSGLLLPITAIIAKYEEENRSMGGTDLYE